MQKQSVLLVFVVLFSNLGFSLFEYDLEQNIPSYLIELHKLILINKDFKL
jgi:hypothetical protein